MPAPRRAVQGAVETKSSRRSVSFGPILRDTLLKSCNAAGPEGRLFHDAGVVQVWKYEAVWVKARKELPERGPGWHHLRHYHASVLISHHFFPVAVAARLGHKEPIKRCGLTRICGTLTDLQCQLFQIQLWRPSKARPPQSRFR